MGDWMIRATRMSTVQISSKLREGADAYFWYCVGCKKAHPLPKSWTFDGDFERPTFTPSFKHSWNDSRVCHYIITNGRVYYCSDCTHAFADVTIDMPDLPDGLKDVETNDG